MEVQRVSEFTDNSQSICSQLSIVYSITSGWFFEQVSSIFTRGEYCTQGKDSTSEDQHCVVWRILFESFHHRLNWHHCQSCPSDVDHSMLQRLILNLNINFQKEVEAIQKVKNSLCICMYNDVAIWQIATYTYRYEYLLTLYSYCMCLFRIVYSSVQWDMLLI